MGDKYTGTRFVKEGGVDVLHQLKLCMRIQS